MAQPITISATERPALYRACIYVGIGWDSQINHEGTEVTRRSTEITVDDFNEGSAFAILKTEREICDDAKGMCWGSGFNGEKGFFIRQGLPIRRAPVADVLILACMGVSDSDRMVTEEEIDLMFNAVYKWSETNLDDDAKMQTLSGVGCDQIDAEWARRDEASRIIGEAIHGAFQGIAESMKANHYSEACSKFTRDEFRSIKKKLSLVIGEKVNEASRHQHTMAQIKASNTTAQSGCSRCECGCKYWENNQCTDCYAEHNPSLHDTSEEYIFTNG